MEYLLLLVEDSFELIIISILKLAPAPVAPISPAITSVSPAVIPPLLNEIPFEFVIY